MEDPGTVVLQDGSAVESAGIEPAASRIRTGYATGALRLERSGREESNLLGPASKAGAYPSGTDQLVPVPGIGPGGVGLEDLAGSYHGHGADERTRTSTDQHLGLVPLPDWDTSADATSPSRVSDPANPRYEGGSRTGATGHVLTERFELSPPAV